VALDIEGSNPSTHPTNEAPIAQRIEHRSSEPGVVGSNPSRRMPEIHPVNSIDNCHPTVYILTHPIE
jgi:hypothetical protein